MQSAMQLDTRSFSADHMMPRSAFNSLSNADNSTRLFQSKFAICRATFSKKLVDTQTHRELVNRTFQFRKRSQTAKRFRRFRIALGSPNDWRRK
jgi:hypothetical protein